MVGNAATQWSSAVATFAYITSSTTVTSVADVSRGACVQGHHHSKSSSGLLVILFV